MSNPRPSIFRDALQVSPERIVAMNDGDLNMLMGQLLRAQAYKCGSPISEIRVNTVGNAKDDGCDGWSAKPMNSDDWLGTTDTCWQFKAGGAGEPARLSNEINKRFPRETLINGGRFVLVACCSSNGMKGEQDRLDKLIFEAKEANIPTEKIVVIGSERLSNWCNQHPAVAACWAGRPYGLWTLDDWSISKEHQTQWQASSEVLSLIDAQRADLDFASGSVLHLHIKGPPGVGKTRFALELCRDAAWRGSVIYIQQASEFRLNELIDSAAADNGVQLIVVADEVQPDQLKPLRNSIGRGNGRIKLITIGHCSSPDPTRIPTQSVDPLAPDIMRKVIQGLHLAMPPEHVDFVTRFADGYVRLALMAANAVVQNPTIDIRGLLSRDDIRQFLDRMLGTGDRRALYVVAVLTSVGWFEDKQNEGKAIAEHLKLDWNTVRANVDDFHRRLSIVPRSGRYRYISPTPLGIHLAVEAWTTYPDILKSLPDILPSESSKDAYFERLKTIASNLHAREYAREELSFFFHIDNFVDPRSVRRWSALSSADPDKAAAGILKALRDTSLEDRIRIKDYARRETVWTLVRLAWKSSSFHDAVKALALLAEAENETWANNATHEFIARYQILLGGTSVPYLDRLSVLDELSGENRPTLTSLVVKALAKAGNRHFSRMESGSASDELPEKEWYPHTNYEHFECVKTSIERLSAIAKCGIVDIQSDLIAAAQDLSMLLRDSSLRNFVASYFDILEVTYPNTREYLRKIIADILYNERKFWKELSATDLDELVKLLVRFDDTSLLGRLHQQVGYSSWDPEEQLDLKALAEEVLSAPEFLKENWAWLTSGEANNAWRLGEAFALLDKDGKLAETLPSLPYAGRDLRVLCGYVNIRRRTQGDEWYNIWVKSQFERSPKPIPLLFEVAWRCGATESFARTLTKILRSGPINPEIVGQLGYGGWGEYLPFEVLEMVVRAMAETGHKSTAIGILANRLKANTSELECWKPLALKLVTNTELIRSKNITKYFWKEVSSLLITDHARVIAAAIFCEQANRKPEIWFAGGNEAESVLRACVDQDPFGIWQEMKSFISSPDDAYMFSIGLPKGLIERMPPDEVFKWITEIPEERASTVAKLSHKSISNDESLVSRILGTYGDNQHIAEEFFSNYLSGSWWGPASEHWNSLADELERVARNTALPKLRRWATDSSRSFRIMAERDRQREEEEELRRR